MNTEQWDLRRLRAFQLAARNGTLAVAARQLNQTVPAISSKIRLLEQTLGQKLFERLPNKLILTQSGKTFLREVDAVFERLDQAIASLSLNPIPKGKLSVSIGSDHSWYFAPKISRFLKEYPGIELKLQVYRATDAVRALIQGELDLSIGIFPRLPKTLESDVIVETTLSLLCRSDHPLARRRSPALSDIARERLITLPRHAETRKLLDRALTKGNLKPRSIIEVANCQTAGSFVEEGVGVAVVHSLCIAHAHSEHVRWIDLGARLGTLPFSVVFRRGHVRSPIIKELLQALHA